MQAKVDLKKLAKELPSTDHVECPLNHYFAPNIYVREIFMPAGSLVLGKTHLTTHLNSVVMGCVRLMMNNKIQEISAPYTFVSEAGTQKALYIVKDCIWQTTHYNPTNTQSVSELEDVLVEDNNDQLDLEEMEALSWLSLM